MSSKSVVKTKSLAPPPTPGEYFRLICMTGQNKGFVYYINSRRVVLGRSDKADVPVLDKKSSREHCELVRHGNTYVMTDLKSQNGVVINDLKVSQHQLVDGDKIIIGQTVFKFSVLKVLAPAIIDEEEDDEEDEEDEEEEVKSNKKTPPANDPAKKKRMMIIGFVVLLLVLMMGGEDEDTQEEQSSSSNSSPFGTSGSGVRSDGFSSDEPEEVRQQVETYIQRGLREYREDNYFRAIREFNLALVLSPNHASASYYLSKTKQRLDEDVEMYFQRARREIESLRYSEAINSYCSIMRLLQSEPNDQRFKDAEESLELVREQMGARTSEIRCIER